MDMKNQIKKWAKKGFNMKEIKTAKYIKAQNGFKGRDFKFDGYIYEYDEVSNTEEEYPVEISGYFSPPERQTRWDPGAPATIEIYKVIDLRTKTEVPDEIIEKYMEELEEQAWKHLEEGDEPDDRRDEEIEDRSFVDTPLGEQYDDNPVEGIDY